MSQIYKSPVHFLSFYLFSSGYDSPTPLSAEFFTLELFSTEVLADKHIIQYVFFFFLIAASNLLQ